MGSRSTSFREVVRMKTEQSCQGGSGRQKPNSEGTWLATYSRNLEEDTTALSDLSHCKAFIGDW
jgi:hypothetical protein